MMNSSDGRKEGGGFPSKFTLIASFVVRWWMLNSSENCILPELTGQPCDLDIEEIIQEENAAGSSFSEYSLDDDVVTLAKLKPGRKATGRSGAWFDEKATNYLLDLSLFYKIKVNGKRNKSGAWEQISCALWYYHALDFSPTQCSGKIQHINSYFLTNILPSKASTYQYFEKLCKLNGIDPQNLPDCATLEQNLACANSAPKKSNRQLNFNNFVPETAGVPPQHGNALWKNIPAANDVWDEAAVLLLLSLYKNIRPAIESARSPKRKDDMYMAISQDMLANQRIFSAQECCKRIESLNNSFYVVSDAMRNQTGAGSSNIPFYAELSEIHDGSVAIDPPITFSVGSEINIRRSTSKFGGSSNPTSVGSRKKKRSWTSKDSGQSWTLKKGPLTHQQQMMELQKAKVECMRRMVSEVSAIRVKVSGELNNDSSTASRSFERMDDFDFE